MENLVYIYKHQKFDGQGRPFFIYLKGCWVVNPDYGLGGQRDEK